MFNCFGPTFNPCGILLERLFSCNSESITAAHVRDQCRQCSHDLFRAEM